MTDLGSQMHHNAYCLCGTSVKAELRIALEGDARPGQVFVTCPECQQGLTFDVSYMAVRVELVTWAAPEAPDDAGANVAYDYDSRGEEPDLRPSPSEINRGPSPADSPEVWSYMIEDPASLTAEDVFTGILAGLADLPGAVPAPAGWKVLADPANW